MLRSLRVQAYDMLYVSLLSQCHLEKESADPGVTVKYRAWYLALGVKRGRAKYARPREVRTSLASTYVLRPHYTRARNFRSERWTRVWPTRK